MKKYFIYIKDVVSIDVDGVVEFYNGYTPEESAVLMYNLLAEQLKVVSPVFMTISEQWIPFTLETKKLLKPDSKYFIISGDSEPEKAVYEGGLFRDSPGGCHFKNVTHFMTLPGRPKKVD